MAEGFRGFIQNQIAKLIFPTKTQDWYRKYSGKTDQERFENFLRINQQNNTKGKEKAYYYEEFKTLDPIKRKFIEAETAEGKKVKLDTIELSPQNSEGKPGKGQHIINFFGVGEYYECNFRDMAGQANHSGATIHAFNPPGMNSSTGNVKEFNDLVNSGIAMVSSLINKGVHPKDIILQGNCLGGAVVEEVHKKFAEQGIELRRINSNSFKSIKSMITSSYPFGLFENTIKKLLQYTGWETKPGKNFGQTTPFAAYMHRKDDRTIKEQSKLHSKIEKYKSEESALKYPDLEKENQKYADYSEDKKYLDGLALMEVKDKYKKQKINPHELDLYKMQCVNNPSISSYEFVNQYIKRSNDWIEKHPEVYANYDSKKVTQIAYAKASPAINLTKAEEQEFTVALNVIKEVLIPEHEKSERKRIDKSFIDQRMEEDSYQFKVKQSQLNDWSKGPI